MTTFEGNLEFSQAPSPEEREGRIYFIQAGDAVKIGYSTRVTERLRSMQTGNHHGLILLAEKAGTRAIEREYHQQFSRFRIKGEWFHAVGPVLKEASEISGVKYRTALHLSGLPKIDPLEGLSPEVRKVHRTLDRQLRNEATETRRTQITHLMGFVRNGISGNFLERQRAIVENRKPRYRVAAKTEVAL